MRFKKILCATLSTAALMSMTSCKTSISASTTKKKNVLWIITDEQNTRTMGVYGNPLGKAPNLDKLAQEGTLFLNHYVSCPQCVASRTSALTGRYCHQNSVIDNSASQGKWPENVISSPEVFAQNGYKTANIGKVHHPKREIWHESDDDHFHQFGQYMTARNIGKGYNPKEYEVIKLGDKNLVVSGIMPDIPEGTPTAQLTDKVLKWLDENSNKSEPFFLHMSILAPHAPFFASKEYYNMFKLEDMNYDEPLDEDLLLLPEYEKAVLRNQKDINRRVNATYYGLAAEVDVQIGRVLDYIKDKGLEEDTIIMFTTDHGHLNGEYGQYGKGQYYDLTVRVPMIIKGPGVPVGKKIDAFTQNVDEARTLMRLAGIEIPEQFKRTGVDMLEPDRKRTEVISEIVIRGVRRSYIRTKEYALDYSYMNFERLGKMPATFSNADKVYRTQPLTKEADGKLIDLTKDPLQHKNVYYDAEYANVVKKLSERLEKRLAEEAVPIKCYAKNNEDQEE